MATLLPYSVSDISTRLKIPETWPWAAAIVAVFANIAAIPQPA
ncbi:MULTISPECIES: hypothetical protein [Kocuria]|nr:MULTISPECIES: hypothetical protein [Kocuria]